MIILVVIVVGVVILVVIFRAKKRKQRLVINKLQNFTTEETDIQLKVNQKQDIEREANSIPNQSLYHMAVTQKKVLPSVPSKSEDVEYLNQNSTLSEDKLVPAENEYALPTKPPRLVNLSKSMLEELESNPMYQSMDQCHDPHSATNVSQVTTSSTTNEMQNGIHETVYSEPIQASLFTDAPRNPMDSEPYAPHSCKNIRCNAGHTTESS